MEDLLRMLSCLCRQEDGSVKCSCPERAPQFRCSCGNCVSQRLAKIEDADLPFEQCPFEMGGGGNSEPLQPAIATMLGVPVATKAVCVLRTGHAGKHQIVPLPGRR